MVAGSQPAHTDPGLARTGNKMAATGAKVLLAGGIMALVGIVLLLVADADGAEAAGVWIAWLAVPVTLLGLGLFLSGRTAGRAARDKTFA